MFKSTIVKWAVAAVLAVPAVPLFGNTTHHRVVHLTHHTHRLSTLRHHRLGSRTHRRLSLAARRKLASHRLSSHRLVHKTGLRHTAMNSTSHFKVHVTKMPPTIDGINT